MEHSPSSSRFTVNRILGAAAILIVTSLLFATVLFKGWLVRRTAGTSPTVRPAAEAVLRAEFWSRFTGAYWETEMETRAPFVLALPERDRLDFFRVIILTCDLDMSRATRFCELVGKDAESLRRELCSLKDSREFARLSEAEQKAVLDWIIQLKVVAELHDASSLK